LHRIVDRVALDAEPASDRGEVDRLQLAAIFRIAEEHHPLPLDLAERVVLDDNDLDIEVIFDAGRKLAVGSARNDNTRASALFRKRNSIGTFALQKPLSVADRSRPLAYRFLQSDKSIEIGVSRIALDQIDKAIDETGSPDVNFAIHQVRKRCKKLRGLLRLVRPAFESYGAENADFRDIARVVSPIRDSTALIDTYDLLANTYEEQLDRRALGSIRRRLTLRKKHAIVEGNIGELLVLVRERLKAARKRADLWHLTESEFDGLEDGLTKTYKRARKAMARLEAEPSAAQLHEWRKRIKYHRYHARLLSPAWPGTFRPHAKAAKQLSDLLGDHHDLSVFRHMLTIEPDEFGRSEDVGVMLSLANRQQSLLAAPSLFIGSRLLAERPVCLAERWRAYWETWRSEVPAQRQRLQEAA
jgi:CHAD domain-containing protein